jgi:hypothetical protein
MRTGLSASASDKVGVRLAARRERRVAPWYAPAAHVAHQPHEGDGQRTKKGRISGPFRGALCRTRTGDPFLTMEVLYQLS